MNTASATEKGSKIKSVTSLLRGFVFVLVCAVSVVAPAASRAAELREETLKTWDTYVQAANSQIGSQTPFLWVDEAPGRLDRVRNGEILVSSVGQQNPRPVPSGLIHDWIGAAFIADAKLSDVLSAVRDYGNYKGFYKPTVVDSKLRGTDGTCDKYSMRVVNKETVAETALDMEYETCYFRTDERRWYSITDTKRVREIRHYGKPNEQELPQDQGSGYVWRLYSIARFEQRDGGVYVEVEAVALSRDIPVAVRWIVNPIVRRVSRNSMLISLRQTQEAVRSREAANRTSTPSTIANENSRSAVASEPGIANSLVSREKP